MTTPQPAANLPDDHGRFARLLEAEGIAPSALTPDLAVELGRRLPPTRSR